MSTHEPPPDNEPETAVKPMPRFSDWGSRLLLLAVLVGAIGGCVATVAASLIASSGGIPSLMLRGVLGLLVGGGIAFRGLSQLVEARSWNRNG